MPRGNPRLLCAPILIAALVFAAVPEDPAGWRVLFQEDFEHGDGAWTLWSGPDAPSATWQLEQDGGTWVYSGSDHTFATATGGSWGDFRLRLRAKSTGNSFHLWFRRIGCSSYTLNVGPTLSLSRTAGCSANPVVLVASAPAQFTLGPWHSLDLLVVGGRIRFYVDDALALDLVDVQPLARGTISFESVVDAHVHLDDIRVTGPVETQGSAWIRTGGPMGGVGYDIRMRPDNPDILLVTDVASGVSISEDAGRTWRPSNSGIVSRAGASGDAVPIFCLTIDSNNPNIAWAGTQNARGIYKSTDGGKSWVQKDNGVVERNGITFRGFAVDPHDSRVVYAAGELSSIAWAGESRSGRAFDMTKGVVYKTTDGGEHWRAVWSGDNLARYVWIDPRSPDRLYVSTGFWDREAANTDTDRGISGGVGLVKSEDGGQTWQVLNQANGLGNLFVGSLFMHPTNSNILLAGTGGNRRPEGEGVYLTTDGGRTWQRTLSTGQEVTAVEISTSDPDIAYAATSAVFYRSSDGGRNWENMRTSGSPAGVGWGPPGVPNGIPVDLQADPRNPNRVFANSYKGGNALTEDGGRTWTNASAGYTGAVSRDVAVDPTDSQRLFAMTRSGPFRSDDGGATWAGLYYRPANVGDWFPSGWDFPEWNAVAVDPKNPDRVLFGDELTGTLLLSGERGRNWRVVYHHPQVTGPVSNVTHGFHFIAFAPSNSMVVYAGMRRDRKTVDFSQPGPSFGIFKSADAGETWHEDAQTASRNVNVLAVNPQSESAVYAGTTAGIFATTDGGQSWRSLNRGLLVLDIRALAIHPRNPSVLYAGAQKGGLYKSVDGGENWTVSSAGMDFGAIVRDIVIDPTNPEVLYAADIASGVYRSDNGGALWVQINRGLSTRAVIALSLSSDGGTLYAATEGEGVFRLDVRPSAAVTSVSAASFLAGGALAGESIASAFGQGLASATQGAAALPLPTVLAGASVVVTDSAGIDRAAPLFFVSPGQVNYLVPAGVSVGQASVRALRDGQVVARGQVRLETVAPALFTANADGKGVPAAGAVRVSADGTRQTPVDVYRCGAAAGSCVPIAIDLGAEGEHVILVLYGTGIRGGNDVGARIGGVNATVQWAGPQGQFVGLDQVNVSIPPDLRGRGEVDLVLTVDGRAANTVTARLQ